MFGLASIIGAAAGVAARAAANPDFDGQMAALRNDFVADATRRSLIWECAYCGRALLFVRSEAPPSAITCHGCGASKWVALSPLQNDRNRSL